jgi:hypothetical protein
LAALNTNLAATQPHLTARRTLLLQQPAFVTSSAPSSHTAQRPLSSYCPSAAATANPNAASNATILGTNLQAFKPTHGITHDIETTGHPLSASACRLDPEKLSIAQSEFLQLEKAGIVHSKSPWSSPLHMVPKKNGSWRPCGDYCHLNTVTTLDSYPPPNLHDFTSQLHNCSIFTTIDLVKAYHQVPLVPQDIPKTA